MGSNVLVKDYAVNCNLDNIQKLQDCQFANVSRQSLDSARNVKNIRMEFVGTQLEFAKVDNVAKKLLCLTGWIIVIAINALQTNAGIMKS